MTKPTSVLVCPIVNPFAEQRGKVNAVIGVAFIAFGQPGAGAGRGILHIKREVHRLAALMGIDVLILLRPHIQGVVAALC